MRCLLWKHTSETCCAEAVIGMEVMQLLSGTISPIQRSTHRSTEPSFPPPNALTCGVPLSFPRQSLHP